MLRIIVALGFSVSVSGCLSNSTPVAVDATVADSSGGNAESGGSSGGSGGQMQTPNGTGAQVSTGGNDQPMADSGTAGDGGEKTDSAVADSGTDNDAAMGSDGAGVGELCGGIAAFTCMSGLVCIDDPRDSCDPLNGGADCGGVCVRDMLCGGFAALLCQAGESCIDDPRDDCDPLKGGADCGGLCLPQSASAACTADECSGPAPAAPNMLCDDGITVSGPACLRDNSGTCAWQIVSCPSAKTSACRVTGCSSEVCAAEDVVTDCNYLPEYDCLKHSVCGTYGPSGTCAWKDSQAYQNCLKSL